MTCKKTERDEHEVRVAEYLRPALANHKSFDVHIKHVPVRLGNIEWLNIAVGSVELPFDPTSGQLIESQAMNEDNTLNVYAMPDGAKAIVIHHPPQRPPFIVPFFAVELHDWPIERSIEEDLGPRFRKALQLLLEACTEARDAAFKLDAAKGEGPYASYPGAITDERNEAAERLEPGPQPQDHDHPRERGKSP